MPAVPAGMTSRVAHRHAFSRFTGLVMVSLFSTSSKTTSDEARPAVRVYHAPARQFQGPRSRNRYAVRCGPGATPVLRQQRWGNHGRGRRWS